MSARAQSNLCRSFRKGPGFFDQHDGNVISNRINHPADITGEAGAVRSEADGRFILGTCQYVEQFTTDGHDHAPQRKNKSNPA